MSIDRALAEADALAICKALIAPLPYDAVTRLVLATVANPAAGSDLLLLLAEAVTELADCRAGHGHQEDGAHYHRLAALVAALAPGRAQ